jgi:hypothetical protein
MDSFGSLISFISLTVRVARCTDFTPDERTFILAAIERAQKGSIPDDNAVTPDPENYLGRIEALWAALYIGDEGGEGLCAAPLRDMTLPLIAVDGAVLLQLMPLARRSATTLKKPVRLAKFTKREDVEIYQP